MIEHEALVGFEGHGAGDGGAIHVLDQALGALKLLNEMPEERAQKATVVTVFTDDNKKYLSTDYTKVEEAKPGFLSPEIELLGATSVRSR